MTFITLNIRELRDLMRALSFDLRLTPELMAVSAGDFRRKSRELSKLRFLLRSLQAHGDGAVLIIDAEPKSRKPPDTVVPESWEAEGMPTDPLTDAEVEYYARKLGGKWEFSVGPGP